MADAHPRKVLAVADSDSYLKWAVTLVAGLGEGWEVQVLVLRTPITPSPEQVRAAAGADLPVVRSRELLARLRATRPDAVLLACTGPVISALLEHPELRGPERPVLVTGLPGISWPVKWKGIRYRSGTDLFVLHSERERRGYAAEAAYRGYQMDFVLATLPFLQERAHHAEGRDIVFAAQAKVPREVGEREAVLRALAAVAPPLRPVVKVRALAHELQTHHEDLPYATLWDELSAREGLPHDRITFRAGSMAEALQDAAGFVTVSSTAALEAIHAKVPTIVLDDFGVSAEMINEVFRGSGLLHGLDDLRAGRFSPPDERWLAENYFHPAGANTWLPRLTELVDRRRARPLGPAQVTGLRRLRGRVWRQGRLLLPAWAWNVANRLRRLRPRRSAAPSPDVTPAPARTARGPHPRPPAG